MKFFLCLTLALLTLTHPVQAAAPTIRYNDAISQYYTLQAVDRLWLDSDGELTEKGATLLKFIGESWQQGLNPDNYHFTELADYAQGNDKKMLPYYDRLFSDAYLQYAHDMSTMRIDGRKISVDPVYWDTALPPDLLLRKITDATDLEAYLVSLEPLGPLYKRLKEEVIAYVTRKDELDKSFKPVMLDNARLLRPGESDPQLVALLRERFALNEAPDDWSKNTYDAELTKAVVDFQGSNHLKADGIIGAETLRLLNKSPANKYYQAIANMERLRWLHRTKPSKYVLVNIPSQTLWTVENDDITQEMRVIVGRKERPTMMFVSEITGVRFNPNWTVPSTIKRDDFLPMLKKDPLSLAAKGIDLKYKTPGTQEWLSLDPTLVDWSTVTPSDMANINMVQQPGPTNPLGTIRILMPNQYNIYLHDTSNPEYFNSTLRAESSGCVRVKEPKKLADFILKSNPDWDMSYVKTMLDKQKMIDVRAAQKIPVYLLYLTVWLNEDGSLTYGPDLYGWDSEMLHALEKADKIAPIK